MQRGRRHFGQHACAEPAFIEQGCGSGGENDGDEITVVLQLVLTRKMGMAADLRRGWAWNCRSGSARDPEDCGSGLRSRFAGRGQPRGVGIGIEGLGVSEPPGRTAAAGLAFTAPHTIPAVSNPATTMSPEPVPSRGRTLAPVFTWMGLPASCASPDVPNPECNAVGPRSSGRCRGFPPSGPLTTHLPGKVAPAWVHGGYTAGIDKAFANRQTVGVAKRVGGNQYRAGSQKPAGIRAL
jgi:hypothetical protein